MTFRTQGVLGRGALGTVLLVQDDSGRKFALKKPRRDISSRVLSSYRSLKKLRSNNVVRIVDVMAEPDEPSIALEYIDGTSLGDLLKKVRELGEYVPLEVALLIIGQSATGLSDLHQFENGWIHGDISPSNILLGNDGRVLISDFDLAFSEDSSAVDKISGGKTEYAAPEVLAGTGHSQASDIFSLGVTFFELLSSRRPHCSLKGAEQIAGIVVDGLEDRDDIDPEVLELLIRMLSADIRLRPEAGEIAEKTREIVERFEGVELSSYIQSFFDKEMPVPMPFPWMVNPPSSEKWRVKGEAVDATIDFLIRQYGETSYGRVLEFVSQKTQRALHDRIEGSAWFDGQIVVELTEAAQYLYGESIHSLAHLIGVWSAEKALSPGGPYQTFRDKGLRKGVPAFLESTEDIYGLYYDVGHWKVIEIRQRYAFCRLEGFRFPDVMNERIFSYLKRGMELAGATDVSIQSEDKEKYVDVTVRWKDRPSDVPPPRVL